MSSVKSKARAWATPAASSGARTSLRPVRWGGGGASQGEGVVRTFCVVVFGRDVRSSSVQCTPSGPSSSKPSDARAAVPGWLQPHSELAK